MCEVGRANDINAEGVNFFTTGGSPDIRQMPSKGSKILRNKYAEAYAGVKLLLRRDSSLNRNADHRRHGNSKAIILYFPVKRPAKYNRGSQKLRHD